MWICLNNAFLSVVSDPAAPMNLLVRARREGDIEAVFGDAFPVVSLPRRDYRFRASIPRETVGAAIAQSLVNIDYGNFKDSVKDACLHDAYASVWGLMAQLQEYAPYSGKKRPGFAAHPVR